MVSKRKAREVKKVYRSLVNLFYSDVPNEYKMEYVALARKLSMKTRVPLNKFFRLFICKGCKKPLLPGVNAVYRLRTRPYKHIFIKCLECGHIYRRGYRKKTKD